MASTGRLFTDECASNDGDWYLPSSSYKKCIYFKIRHVNEISSQSDGNPRRNYRSETKGLHCDIQVGKQNSKNVIGKERKRMAFAVAILQASLSACTRQSRISEKNVKYRVGRFSSTAMQIGCSMQKRKENTGLEGGRQRRSVGGNELRGLVVGRDHSPYP
jgi:hypothetical protein